jgi:DNA polymerase alpha subunit A
MSGSVFTALLCLWATSNVIGLDPTRYAATTGQIGEKQFFTFESQISDKERFKDVDPLSVRCASCASAFTFEGLLEDTVSHSAILNHEHWLMTKSNAIQATGIVCPACSTAISTPSLAVQIDIKIRAHIAKYYLAWTVCDEDDCGARTRMMGVYGKRCLGLVKPGCKGNIRLEVSLTLDHQAKSDI